MNPNESTNWIIAVVGAFQCFETLLLETKGAALQRKPRKQVISAGAHQQRVAQVNLLLTRTRLRCGSRKPLTVGSSCSSTPHAGCCLSTGAH